MYPEVGYIVFELKLTTFSINKLQATLYLLFKSIPEN